MTQLAARARRARNPKRAWVEIRFRARPRIATGTPVTASTPNFWRWAQPREAGAKAWVLDIDDADRFD